MLFSELLMAITILLIPLMFVSNFNNTVKFILWILLLSISSLSSGVNQTYSFSFSSEMGDNCSKMVTIGQAIGGMFVSLLCLLFTCLSKVLPTFQIGDVSINGDDLGSIIY